MKLSTLFITAALSVCAATVLAQEGPPPQGGPGGGQGPRPRQGMRMMGGPLGMAQLVMRPDVQADLGLTEDQIQQLRSVMPRRARPQGPPPPGAEAGGPPPPGGVAPGGPPPPNSEAGGPPPTGGPPPGGAEGPRPDMRARQQEMLAKVDAILTPPQQKRLEGIFIQIAGNSSVLEPKVGSDINLSDEQKSKIDELMNQQREANRALREKMQSGEITREQIRAQMQQSHRELNEKIGSILNDHQRSRLKSLAGKPFKQQEPPRPNN